MAPSATVSSQQTAPTGSPVHAEPPPITRVACDCCGSTNIARDPRLSQHPWCLARCADCGFVFLENPPAAETLEDEFAWEDMMAGRRKRRDSGARKAVASIRRFGKSIRGNKLRDLVLGYLAPGDTLDLGCGSGTRWDDLPPAYIPVGVEIEPKPAQLADERFKARGGRCLKGGVVQCLDSLEDRSASGAILRAYLEHEPEPFAVLDAMARVLEPGARVLVKVPNYGSINAKLQGSRWCGWRLPEHVNYFTPATLTGLMQRAGYKTARFGPTDKLPLSDNMWAVFER
ncbi:MAG: class I SAM-dependent methyltransferase [Planctomycetota bacterium]